MSLEIALVNLAAWSVQVAVLALAAAAASRSAAARAAGRPAAPSARRCSRGSCCCRSSSRGAPCRPPLLWSATLARPALAGHAGAGTATPAPPGWPLLVALALTAGVLVQLGRLALGLARLRTLSRGAATLEPPPWLDALRREIAPRTAFVVCAEAVSPATCGLRRPTVLLPRLFLDLGREQQRAIALHELLHVRRGDWAVQVGEELVRAALFFHPAVRWLIARVRLAREQAVDAEAVEPARRPRRVPAVSRGGGTRRRFRPRGPGRALPA